MQFATLKFEPTITNILIHLRIKSRIQSKYSLQFQRKLEGLRCVLGVDGLREDISVDRFYMPIRASQFDVWTLERANFLVESAQLINRDLKAYVFINLASPNPLVNETKETREFIKDFDNFDLAESVIRDRIVFRKATLEGVSVVEVGKGDRKADYEIYALYDEVFNNGQTTIQEPGKTD